MEKKQETKEQRLLRAFIQRKADNAKVTRIDNSRLPAGSMMYYYCRLCGAQHATMFEDHRGPVPQPCSDCKRAIDDAVIDSTGKALL